MRSKESIDSFHSRAELKTAKRTYVYFKLDAVTKAGLPDPSRLPVSLRILLEHLIRCEDGDKIKRADIEDLVRWSPRSKPNREIAFTPARVILQDFTGVPAVVDFAAMRDAMKNMGGNPQAISPLQPADLVIDHSVQVDSFGSERSFSENTKREFQRNQERYQFLRWGQKAFRGFRVVPPGTGIVHQVNLEYLADVVFAAQEGSTWYAYPDTLVGTDSHTTMINGLGVLGWGVGGIEAEAAMLGQPISMLIPEVVGVKLLGSLPEGTTATDLVLTVTQMLREKGVVGKFVEFYGDGLHTLSLPDRATLANMAPEYGATVGFFPVDQETLRYLRLSGRSRDTIDRVEAYTKAQGLFRTNGAPDPEFSDVLTLDLKTVEPSLAGPKRPQDRVRLSGVKQSFQKEFGRAGSTEKIDHGSVVIAAITSCTNTSNPSVMLGAGILAKKAVERGLYVKPWVKTSLAPGSKVVMEYLKTAGLLKPLEALKFHLVGYGCTTCIGNSGPLPEDVAQAVTGQNLVTAAVLSGNRNFEGRINSLVRANYLASPPLVVAYAIAGSVNLDLTADPIGKDASGHPVYLRDVWPTQAEIGKALAHVSSEMFQTQYAHVFEGDQDWNSIKAPSGDLFEWDSKSTYIKNPPFFDGMPLEPEPLRDIHGARVLAVFGDSVTTDHISPAGAIPKESPAGSYLMDHGVMPQDFNSYGARRGNFEVMIRGTFGNIRIKNQLVPGTEGGWTLHLPDKERMTIFEAAMNYKAEHVPLVILAGKEYGTGSSRDWAAKGPALLGVRAVIAESFERIHRSNLLGMGILPLEFEKGESWKNLGLTGTGLFEIEGLEDRLSVGAKLTVTAKGQGNKKSFRVTVRIDTPQELKYYQHGGILPYVLRSLLDASA
ncbi:MAG: aconitate hydratase 1 [Omnitrophica bacterium RIFCSPLOWO2_01_FULL_50_24]|nr:MAG: aconitate hydratase 1 [Omnitrophica bacterium RIFCSPLOWO2_01_FULL_50_24]